MKDIIKNITYGDPDIEIQPSIDYRELVRKEMQQYLNNIAQEDIDEGDIDEGDMNQEINEDAFIIHRSFAEIQQEMDQQFINQQYRNQKNIDEEDIDFLVTKKRKLVFEYTNEDTDMDTDMGMGTDLGTDLPSTQIYEPETEPELEPFLMYDTTENNNDFINLNQLPMVNDQLLDQISIVNQTSNFSLTQEQIAQLNQFDPQEETVEETVEERIQRSKREAMERREKRKKRNQ